MGSTLKKLCVVLITQESDEHDESRASFRDYASSEQMRDRVRYTYIFREKQHKFLNALTAGKVNKNCLETFKKNSFVFTGVGPPEASDLHIVIIWRQDRTHLKYEWLNEKWKQADRNRSKEILKSTISKLLFSEEPLRFEAEIQVRLKC